MYKVYDAVKQNLPKENTVKASVTRLRSAMQSTVLFISVWEGLVIHFKSVHHDHNVAALC